MYSTEDTAGSLQWVSPFGNLRVNRLFTANRSLSQCPTSFIGTWRQGIHRKLLVASPRDAENLILFGLHQKDQYLFGCQGSISLSCGSSFAVDRRSVCSTSVEHTDQLSTCFYRQCDPAHRRVTNVPCDLSFLIVRPGC